MAGLAVMVLSTSACARSTRLADASSRAASTILTAPVRAHPRIPEPIVMISFRIVGEKRAHLALVPYSNGLLLRLQAERTILNGSHYGMNVYHKDTKALRHEEKLDRTLLTRWSVCRRRLRKES